MSDPLRVYLQDSDDARLVAEDSARTVRAATWEADRGSVESLMAMQSAAGRDLEASLVRLRGMHGAVTPFLG